MLISSMFTRWNFISAEWWRKWRDFVDPSQKLSLSSQSLSENGLQTPENVSKSKFRIGLGSRGSKEERERERSTKSSVLVIESPPPTTIDNSVFVKERIPAYTQGRMRDVAIENFLDAISPADAQVTRNASFSLFSLFSLIVILSLLPFYSLLSSLCSTFPSYTLLLIALCVFERLCGH